MNEVRRKACPVWLRSAYEWQAAQVVAAKSPDLDKGPRHRSPLLAVMNWGVCVGLLLLQTSLRIKFNSEFCCKQTQSTSDG